jgi:hypothetical protein
MADYCAEYGAGEFSGAQFGGFCAIPDLDADSGQPILDELLGDPIKARAGREER